MMDFLTLKPKSFGLDISDLSLKIAKLKKKGKFLSLDSFAELNIKPGIVEGGELKDEQAFIKSVKDILANVKGEKLKTSNVIVSLPENKSFFTVVKMPKMKEEELRLAVPFEAENYIPMPFDEVYYDFQIISSVKESPDHLDVLVSAIPKSVVDPYIACLKKTGLTVRALEIESQSISRAMIKKELSPFPVLIVDLGRSNTNFIVYSGYSIRFASSSFFSSSQLTEAISKSLNVSLEEAEALKIKCGLDVKNQARDDGSQKSGGRITKKEVFEAMVPALADLTGQIKRYLAYYQTHANHEHLASQNNGVEKVILCGRGSTLKGLADFLYMSLKIPVELGNPWINILPEPLKEVPGLPFEESLGYATALGLALRGIRE